MRLTLRAVAVQAFKSRVLVFQSATLDAFILIESHSGLVNDIESCVLRRPTVLTLISFPATFVTSCVTLSSTLAAMLLSHL